MHYTIVPMTAAQLDQVEAIERACFSDAWSRRLLEDMLTHPGAISLAAVDGEGAVLGYASAQTVLDEGYIDNVAVAPDARRHGVASALLDVFCRFGAVNLAFLTLEVRQSNTAAIALYEKHGFRQAGLRPGYYQHPREDAVIMTREFSKEEEV